MSRFGAKKGRQLPGAEFTYDGGEDTANASIFPKVTCPHPRFLKPREQTQVDYYRDLRERFHDGPYYAVLDSASSTAKKGSAARVNFDPFNGMPSYSVKYQKKKRTIPRIQGRPYVLKFFPRDLWKIVQPSYKPEAAMDGYVPQTARIGAKRGFEDDEEEEDDAKRQKGGEEDEEDADRWDDENDLLDPDEEQEEEIMDDDFSDDDDDMGGDYNAEQYFDGGDDEYGDDGFGDGGGGGDEETF